MITNAEDNKGGTELGKVQFVLSFNAMKNCSKSLSFRRKGEITVYKSK